MPGPAPRTSGGFRPSPGGLGRFDESYLEQDAMKQTMSQKGQAQAGTSSAQPTTGGSALKALGSKQQQSSQSQVKARPIGSFKDELLVNPAKDIVKSLTSFFDLNQLLEIKTEDTPEEQAKKKQMLNRWNNLNEEQKSIAQSQYQEKIKKQQAEEEKKQQKKKQEEEVRKQSIAPPSSPKKGPIGPGSGMSKKAAAAAKLEQDRKTLGSLQSAG